MVLVLCDISPRRHWQGRVPPRALSIAAPSPRASPRHCSSPGQRTPGPAQPCCAMLCRAVPCCAIPSCWSWCRGPHWPHSAGCRHGTKGVRPSSQPRAKGLTGPRAPQLVLYWTWSRGRRIPTSVSGLSSGATAHLRVRGEQTSLSHCPTVPLSHCPTVPLGVGRATDWLRSGGSGCETTPACGTAVVPSRGLHSVFQRTQCPGALVLLYSSAAKQELCAWSGPPGPAGIAGTGPRAAHGDTSHKPTDGAVSSGAVAHDGMREHHR